MGGWRDVRQPGGPPGAPDRQRPGARGGSALRDLRGRTLWTEHAWLPGGWRSAVRLTVGPDGRWASVEHGVPPGPDTVRLDGPALPGLVDAHSHAFQRAFAGLAERRVPDRPRDDFWSWREAMYRVARRLGPRALRAVAAQLDVELLRGGYTQVCEFHYLHGPPHDEADRQDCDPGQGSGCAGRQAPVGGKRVPDRPSSPVTAAEGRSRDPQTRPAADDAVVADRAGAAGSAMAGESAVAAEGRSRIEQAGARAPPGCGIEHALEGALALADAAAEAGIGLTLLPALYERAGFGQPALRPEQRRFAGSVESVCALRDALRAGRRPGLDVGLAIHSLRAVSADSILRLLERLDDAPLHLHIAEQASEVADCLAATGRRPIDWLAASVPLDARWQLVHATHATPAEIDTVARRGAGVVLCPGTEADLGDGLPDLPLWLDAGVPLAIGSDSQVTRDWPAELRLLEHGQRLALRRRNVAASADEPSTAARLFGRVLDGGAAAAGHACWGLVVGARADLLVLDLDEPALLGVEPARRLDALVFASAARPFRDVLVGGRWSLRGHRHVAGAGIAARFEAAVREVATGSE